MVIDLVVSMVYYKADKKVDWMGILSVAYLENGKVVYSVDLTDIYLVALMEIYLV